MKTVSLPTPRFFLNHPKLGVGRKLFLTPLSQLDTDSGPRIERPFIPLVAQERQTCGNMSKKAFILKTVLRSLLPQNTGMLPFISLPDSIYSMIG